MARRHRRRRRGLAVGRRALIGNAFGNAIYFAMVWSQAEEASEFAARLADQHALVCFDPQLETLRPLAPSGTRRSWFRRSR